MGQFIRVASTTDVAPGETKCVEASGKKIALFNLEGSFYAIDDTCTHRDVPLAWGCLQLQDGRGAERTCAARRRELRGPRPGFGRRSGGVSRSGSIGEGP